MPKVVTFSLFLPLSTSSCAVWASAQPHQEQSNAASIFFMTPSLMMRDRRPRARLRSIRGPAHVRLLGPRFSDAPQRALPPKPLPVSPGRRLPPCRRELALACRGERGFVLLQAVQYASAARLHAGAVGFDVALARLRPRFDFFLDRPSKLLAGL